jgi:ATP-binding cassette subfamily B protein
MRLSFLLALWPYVRPYRRAYAGCLVILLISFGVELLGPLLVRSAIDGPLSDATAGRTGDRGLLLWLSLGYLGVAIAGTWLGYAYGLLTAWNGQRVVRDVRRQLFAHLLHLSPRFFDRNPAGKLTTRVTTDVENLNELISTGVLQTLFDLLKIFGVLIVLFLLDVRLALFTLLCAPVVIALSLLFRHHASSAYRQVRGRLASQNAFTAEAVGGIRATRAFDQQAAVQRRYAQLNGTTADAWRNAVFHFSLFFSLVDLAIRYTQIGMLGLGGLSILDNSMSAGEFVQFWLYFTLLTTPIKQLGEKYNVLQAAFASTERIVQILTEPVFPPSTPRGAISARNRAQVSFEAIDFSYVPGTPVLEDISFTAEPGQTVAIVGPTGAGKTTLVSLVSRLQDPLSGRILLDGTDLRDLDVTSVRRRVGVVTQDVFLFTGTILDNIRLFDTAIGEEKVWHNLELVGAADFVRRLPAGLLAQVEERGSTFSQGERQLLSFARALVAEPDLLVLDEATAAIDSESEERLQRALDRAIAEHTALVVAHRLSTVRDADLILVMDRGRIVERGRHRELVSLGGIYARMVQSR